MYSAYDSVEPARGVLEACGDLGFRLRVWREPWVRDGCRIQFDDRESGAHGTYDYVAQLGQSKQEMVERLCRPLFDARALVYLELAHEDVLAKGEGYAIP